MSMSTRPLILSAALYLFALLAVFLLRLALKKYRGKWFAIPYDRLPIAIALALLVTAAGVLTSGNEKMANDIAIMAYYLLVLGVTLQIINYIREQRAGKRDEGLRDRESRYRDEDEDRTAEEK